MKTELQGADLFGAPADGDIKEKSHAVGDTPGNRLAADIWHEAFNTVVKELPNVREREFAFLQSRPEFLRQLVESLSRMVDGTKTFAKILADLPQERKSEATAAAATDHDRPAKTEWALALNLTTNFDKDPEGKFYRLEDLRKFAEKTKGKSIAIVVQAAFQNELEKPGASPTYTLERYVIRDGVIRQVIHGQSKGYAQDLKELTQYAAKNTPSDKLALVLDSHGTGNKGLYGDTGTITLPEFVKNVKDGLAGSGREKIDVIHFDTCLMAQNGAMNRIKEIADRMVASPEIESTKGITLVPLWDKLVSDPKTTPESFAREIVRQARIQGAEREKANRSIPIDIISHVDLRKHEPLRQSLDVFGDLLVEALKDSNNKVAIEEAIDKSRNFGRGWTGLPTRDYVHYYRADLKDFAELIIRSIEDGRLTDDNRKLKAAAEDVLLKRGQLVDSSYAHGEYVGTGGVSVFLPGRNMRNVDREARLMTTAGRIADATEPERFAEINKDAKTLAAFLQNAKMDLLFTRPFLFFGVKGVDSELKVLGDAIQGFERATTEDDRRKSFARIHRAATNLETCDHFQKLQARNKVILREKVAEEYKAQLIDDKDTSGWARFRLMLRDSRK